MKMTRRAGLMATITSVGFAIGGCGGTPNVDTSEVEATVNGTVKISGVPVKAGELIFDPANYQRPANKRTTEIKDGAYTIKTLTGRNIIKISGTIAKQKPLLQQQTQSFEVKTGDNTFDMDFAGK